MTKVKSLKTMIEELYEKSRKLDAKFTDWEYEFLEDVHARLVVHNGDTTFLSAKQTEVVEKLHLKKGH